MVNHLRLTDIHTCSQTLYLSLSLSHTYIYIHRNTYALNAHVFIQHWKTPMNLLEQDLKGQRHRQEDSD